MTREPRPTEPLVLDALDAVRARHRGVVLRTAVAGVGLAVAGLGAAALARSWGAGGGWVPAAAVAAGAVAVGSAGAAAWSLRRWRDRLALARRVERRFPDLDARLLTLVEPPVEADADVAADGATFRAADGQASAARARPTGYFRQVLVEQVVDHDRKHPWAATLVPTGWVRAATAGGATAGVAVAIVGMLLAGEFRRKPDLMATLVNGPAPAAPVPDFELKVEPEDASVERGTSLIVLARFGERLPADVQLLVRGGDGNGKGIAKGDADGKVAVDAKRQSGATGADRSNGAGVAKGQAGESGVAPASGSGSGSGSASSSESGATRPARAGNPDPGSAVSTELRMTKSLDDPVFAGRIASVDGELSYAVRFGDRQTRWYKVGVYEHPELRQADARLTFPTYTKLPEKTVEDTRSVTAVEGTKADLTFRLNKRVAKATLVPGPARQRAADGANPTDPAAATAAGPAVPLPPVALTPDPADPSVYHAAIDLKQSATYRLDLADDAGRASKRPAELAVHVTANRPPDLKLDFPAKDVDVSPIEELSVRAKVWDDFGVKRVGVSYALAGQPPTDVVLAQDVAGKDRKEVGTTVALEKLAAQPDQLLSYYFWAEDYAADGTVRRTSGDMFFAEVRPFEEIFRQGEQPSEDEQEQQQQSQQAGQNAKAGEEAAESQKQIVAATWKVARRETSAVPSPQFAPDVKLLAESQAAAKEKAAAMAEKLTDERSKAFLANVLKQMDAAVAALNAAADGTAGAAGGTPATQPADDGSAAKGQAAGGRLATALPAEQAAYQELLKLRAREHDVVRGNRRPQQGQQSASSANSRRQRQLDQLKLADEKNRYEQQRSAKAQQEPQEAQQKETRQVLSRLRELAQRQEDLNRQMKEMQSALAEAKEPAKKEELQRQLARLRDQQRDMLRDTDELQNRMDQPENQERMADARQQLEQTRDDVRKAAESLEQGKVQEASAAGARAGEKFDQLREDFRRAAAGQFNQAMDQMRADARELDQRQQDLSQRLAEMDGAASPRAADAKRQAADDPKSNGQSASNRGQKDGATAGASKPGTPASESDGAPRGDRTSQPPRPPSLRSAAGGREQVAEDLNQQKQRLEKLLEDMRQTTESAESAQPLLSKQLYDAVRQAHQQRTDEALDNTRQLVDRGFVDQAKQAEGEATKGIGQLRERVEQAARGVLGDETEALKRAKAELDELSRQLEREMAKAGQPTPPRGDSRDAKGEPRPNGQRPDGAPTGEGEQTARASGSATRPAGGGDPAVARAGDGRAADRRNGDERAGREGQTGEQPQASNRRPGEQQGNSAQAGEQPREQPGQGQQAGPGAQPGQDQQAGGGGRRPGRDPAQASARGANGQRLGGRGQPPGQAGQRGQGNAAGEGDPQEGDPQGGEPSQPGEGQQAANGEPAGRPGRGQRGGQRQQAGEGQQAGRGQTGGQRQAGGLRPGGGQVADGRRQGGRANPTGGGGGAEDLSPRGADESAGGDRAGPADGREDNNRSVEARAADARDAEADAKGGPLSGDAFRQWSDRLRDVEEMVGDPKLRAEAARIRERAKALRAETAAEAGPDGRHSRQPNWDVVRSTISGPLLELRQAVNEELRRRDSAEALVPIDREPVPPAYAEQVRRYYERLGSGR